MARTAVLGMPRVGRDRELKFALESYWAGRTGRDELEETARALRERNWRLAESTGIKWFPPVISPSTTMYWTPRGGSARFPLALVNSPRTISRVTLRLPAAPHRRGRWR